MSNDNDIASQPLIGIVGFGAFGRLMARHLRHHFQLCAYDPALPRGSLAEPHDVKIADLPAVANCPIVVLAVPINRLDETARMITPHLRQGALVLDVGSVKAMPAEIMKQALPEHVEIVATHPLFGPQSARNGIDGLKIAVCPLRGRHGFRIAAFLRKTLRLNVVMTTPEAHDREAAMVQGLTHFIAKALVQMEPLPRRMTTRSFDFLMQAVGMVRDDAPEVYQAIERSNPYSREVRRRFIDVVRALDTELADPLS